LVTDEASGVEYEISVKAKKKSVWPAVKGIYQDNQYIVFVDIYRVEAPTFYILNNEQWQKVLRDIQSYREDGSEIIRGALEWNWIEGGKPKRFRGSLLKVKDVEKYINNWEALPVG